MALEQKLAGSEGVGQANKWGKSFLGKKNALACLRNSKEAALQSEKGEWMCYWNKTQIIGKINTST